MSWTFKVTEDSHYDILDGSGFVTYNGFWYNGYTFVLHDDEVVRCVATNKSWGKNGEIGSGLVGGSIFSYGLPSIADLDMAPDSAPAMMFYGDPYKTEDLKCKCYVCAKEISPSQRWDYNVNMYNITMKCCGREEVVKLTEDQIKRNNQSGFYFAFMGAR